jgi:hypothetical protein
VGIALARAKWTATCVKVSSSRADILHTMCSAAHVTPSFVVTVSTFAFYRLPLPQLRKGTPRALIIWAHHVSLIASTPHALTCLEPCWLP